MKKVFTYDDRQLEVQAAFLDGVLLLAVYENGSPVGGLQYQIDGSLELGVEGSDLLERLMVVVAEDFCRSSDRAKESQTAEQTINAEKIVDLVLAKFDKRQT